MVSTRRSLDNVAIIPSKFVRVHVVYVDNTYVNRNIHTQNELLSLCFPPHARRLAFIYYPPRCKLKRMQLERFKSHPILFNLHYKNLVPLIQVLLMEECL